MPHTTSALDELAAQAAAHLPDPAIWLDGDLRVKWANAAAEEAFGWTRDAAIGTMQVLDLVHPDDMATVVSAVATVADKPVGTLIETRVRDAAGRWRHIELRGKALDGGAGGLLLSVRDITDRNGWDASRGDEALLRTVVESSSTPVFVCDAAGVVRSASAALPRVLGWDREFVVGRRLRNLAARDHRRNVDAALEETGSTQRNVDVCMLEPSGAERPFRLEVSDLRDDPAVGGYVVYAHDIGDLHHALERMRALADKDPLTGLANRTALLRELRARLDRRSGPFAVLFCDLDGFKSVNDLLGHGTGDDLLCIVAERLYASVRSGDLVARLGGDEFVVVCDTTEDALEGLVERVEQAVQGTPLLGAGAPEITASVGAVLAHPGTMSAEEILAEADSEMYRVKAWRRGLQALPATVSQRRKLANELIRGFERGEIQAHFQPIVALADSTVHGFETLVRWQHPERGLLPPSEFLAVCEEAGLDGRLAEVTIGGAVELLNACDDGISVSLNMSPQQLSDPTATGMLLEHAACVANPSRLIVEVTERAVIDRQTRDGRPVTDVLADIQTAGIRVAVDDFGTGTASLSRLLEAPAEILKIDRSFVAGIGNDKVASALVRSVVALAAELGYSVVAEGVETAAQEQMLLETGCAFAQGWRYAKALPFADAATVARNGEPLAGQ